MRSKLLILALLGLLVLAGTVSAADKFTQGLRYPCLTPDGKQVVFCYRGDIWVSPVDGNGPVRRLTLHEAQDTLPRISPDGKTVAFTSARNGNYDVFTVPITGGQPKQVTFHSAYEAVCDWSPDGTKILFTTNRPADFGRVDLFEVNLAGGTPRRVTMDGGRDASYSPDGKWIVYARGFVDIYWDNYKGASNFDLYVIPAEGGTPKQLTQTRGNERYPFFGKDGKTIYFLAEEKGVANFYSMPLTGGERKQVSEFKGADVHRPDLSFDGETIVFERVGRIYATKLADPDEKTKAMPLVVRSDVRHSGIEQRTITSGGEHANISPARGEVAFMLRGDIWVMPAGGGKGRRITSGPAVDQWPRFSPDGSKIAYFSNAAGNNDIFVIDMRTGVNTQVTRNRANDHFQNWSPDGKHLVFTSERSGNKDIWLLELSSGLTTQVTKHSAADDDPCFSPDGTQICFDSGRDGSQAIYMMNVDGTGLRRVTSGAGFNQVPSMSPDGRMIVYESYSPASGRSGGLYVTYVGGGPAMMISRDGQTAHWSPAGDYIYFHAGRGRTRPGIYRVKAPTDVNAGELVPFIGTVEVNLREELATLFDEAWTALRDGFYDTKMHGVNWNDMKKKYRAMAIDAENKSEFQNIVRQMLAELGASHLGIGGGQRNGSSVTPSISQNGYLGLEFEAQTKDGYKIESILPGGPADKAGMRVGDVVTRIGRAKLGVKTNLDRLTAGTIGKDLPVTFKPLSETGLGRERTIALQPISLRSVSTLRRRHWTETCQRRVREDGKGKVGYIHIAMMMPPNLMQFQQQIAGLNRSRKIKGLVLDVRNNGGGNIHNQLIAILSAKPLARVQVRGGPKIVQPSLYWDHPIVLLTNERSFSDAEVFPHMFKAAGLGKVVGVPTAGGVIGTNDITLSDGSMFRVPRVGYWSLEGKNLEGWGIEPDFLVRETPEDRLNGRDPQLAKALEVIREEMKAIEDAKKAAKAKAAKKSEPKPEPEKKPEPKPVKPEAKPEAQPVVNGLSTLADVRTGEWVVYDIAMPEAGKTKLKVSVTELKDGVVCFATEVLEGSPVELPLPAELRQVRVLESLAGMGKVKSHTTIDGVVKGKPAKLLLVDMEWPDGSNLMLTFTNAVPAYGLLKVEMNKVAIMQAVDWGVAEVPPEKKPEETPEAKMEPVAPDHPIFGAEVGEWVRVRRFAPNGQEVEMVIKIVEVKEEEVILRQTLKVQGREASRDTPRKRDEKLVPPDDFTLVSYGKETVTIGDKELACHVMTATDPNGVEWQWFVSPEVAVNGYVRVVRDGESVLEIIEWGEEG